MVEPNRFEMDRFGVLVIARRRGQLNVDGSVGGLSAVAAVRRGAAGTAGTAEI